MIEKFRNLIIRYSIENKYADSEFVNEVLTILSDNYNVKDFKTYKIIDEEVNGYSDFNNSLIAININYIKSNMINRYKYDDETLNVYMVNIYTMLVLFHEYNHFRQLNIVCKKITSDDFLDKLFVDSFIISFKNLELINSCNNTNYGNIEDAEKLYNLCHDCSATERMAQFEAYNLVLKIISKMQLVLGEVYYLFMNYFNAYKLKEYYLLEDNILCPWDIWIAHMELYNNSLDEILNEDEIKDQDEVVQLDVLSDIIDKYNVNTRVCYGLPITKEEYKNIQDFVNVMYVLSGYRGFLFDDGNIGKKKVRKKDVD